jgi:hypothetical protein
MHPRKLLLFVCLSVTCAALAAVVLISRGFLPAGESGRPAAPGLVESDLEAESRDLDRQLQNTDTHRELLDRLSADLIARRRTLPEAAAELADFSRRRWPEWLGGAGKRWVGPDEETARRLAAEYRRRHAAWRRWRPAWSTTACSASTTATRRTRRRHAAWRLNTGPAPASR